ncbi:MAG: hypothetical protein M3O70_00385 [Actinomycetota bacterium]|nr:hypothetical protein [Actinomycetota bacterium]
MAATRAATGQAGLAAAVDSVLAVAVEGLDEAAVRGELAANERQIRRLQARNTQLTATLARLQAAREPAGRPGDVRAERRAAVEVQRSLTEELGWSPSRPPRRCAPASASRALPSPAMNSKTAGSGRVTPG